MKMEPLDKRDATELKSLYLLDPALAERLSEMTTNEPRTFELPKSIWVIMLASYAVFFLSLICVLGGDARALFMLVISLGYTAMYFGTAYVLNGVGVEKNEVRRSDIIETLTGPLNYGAAFAQILAVPLIIALFGICVSIIIAAVT